MVLLLILLAVVVVVFGKFQVRISSLTQAIVMGIPTLPP
jgi:hypothetical protein